MRKLGVSRDQQPVIYGRLKVLQYGPKLGPSVLLAELVHILVLNDPLIKVLHLTALVNLGAETMSASVVVFVKKF